MNNREFFLHSLSNEYMRFRNVVAAVIPDKLDWKPDPKARSSQDLIEHLIGHVQDLIELIDEGIIHHKNQVPFETLSEGLDQFNRSYKELEAKLAAMSDASWTTPADFFAGEHLVTTAPVRDLMWLFLFDAIHHRGQLSTHLRPTGGKVPAIYGPSADDVGH